MLALVAFLPTGFWAGMSGSGASLVKSSHCCWSLCSMVSTSALGEPRFGTCDTGTHCGGAPIDVCQ